MAARRIGDYELGPELGHGAYGVVHRAIHPPSGRAVALKLVRTPRPGMLASMRREIRALSRLRHPGIVRILDDGVYQGAPWYAMELLEGRTLRDRIGAARPSGAWRDDDLRRLLSILRRLCAPLAYLHGEGMVHRDLKPRNVVVRDDGFPVIVDFGLMMDVPREGRESLDLPDDAGTAAYMPPEQMRGELTDARADLFALGCILYAALTGVPAFPTGRDILDPAFVPPAPSRIAPGLPPALDRLVERLLAHDARRRVGHADDVARALEELGAEDGCAGAPRARPYLYRPALAGRADLVEALSRHVRTELSERGAFVVIGGESGIGKTRLAIEVALRLRAEGARIVACESAGTGVPAPFGALRPLLQALARAADDREELRSFAPVLAPHEPGFAPHVTAPAGALPPREARQRLLDTVAAALRALAAPSPVVLVADDLQWCDELSLALLAILRAPEQRGGVAVIATYRADESTAAIDALVAGLPTHLVLSPLDREALGTVVTDMLGGEAPDPALAEIFWDRTEGNPFFASEYLRACVEEGWIERRPGGAIRLHPDLPRPGSLPLPAGLRDLTRRRIEALGEAARNVAAIAALLGREQDAALLSSVAGGDEAAFLEALFTLVARHVLVDAAPGRTRFAHDQLRDAAYKAIPASRLPELHDRAARAIEALPADAREEHQGALGRHWELAGDAARARDAYLRAARRASGGYALSEAETLYHAHLRLAEPGAARAVARTELSQSVLTIVGKLPEAAAEAQAAADEARAAGDRAALAGALRHLAAMRSTTGDLPAGRALYEESASLDEAIGNPLGAAMTERYLGILEVQQGNLAAAESRFRSAFASFRAHGDRSNEAIALGNIGTVLNSQGRCVEAVAVLREAIALHRENGDRRFASIDLGNLANAESQLGRPEDARRHYHEGIEGLRTIGDPRFEAILLSNLGQMEQELGNLPDAQTLCARAHRIFRGMGDRRSATLTQANLSSIALGLGRRDEAARLLSECIEAVRATGDRRMEGMLLVHRGNMEADVDPSQALETLEEALVLLRSVGERYQEVLAKISMATALARLDRPQEARARANEALAGAREHENPKLAARAEEVLARLPPSG